MTNDGQPALTPKLRFPEFRDAEGWIQSQIDDIAVSESSSLALNKLSLRPTGYAVYGADSCVGFIDSYAQSEDYIAIVKDGSGVGRLSLKRGESSVLGTLAYIKCKPSSRTTLSWLFYCLNSIDFRKFVKGTGIPHIYFADFATHKVLVPPSPEQQKIADCLTSVDDLIAAHVRKVNALKTHKKGLMQQLFPCEGETQPRLRFPEFQNAGEWGEAKLGNHVAIGSGNSPSNFTLSSTGKYALVKVEDLNNCTKYQITGREFCDDSVGAVPMNSIVFPKRGAAIELNKIRITAAEILIDTNLMALTPKNGLTTEFLYYCIANVGLSHIADTSTIPQINNKHIIPFNFLLPTLPEQQRIADCLTSLDALIAAQAHKLDTLKAHKKGLMQQLFPSPEEVEA